jgi:hypothetical protein
LADLPGVPAPERNQADALGRVEIESEARLVLDAHRRGLSSRRQQILTHEKYLIHLDGEGDGQWADVFMGDRVEIPIQFPGEIRVTENLLRPIVDNAVAYHTTMPFRFVAESKPDRESRQRSMIDQALVNHMSAKQMWNRVFAEAMQWATVAGHCPVHGFWRDDVTAQPYEPVGMEGKGLRRGQIDAYVGDPFDTVYNPGAKRNSVHWATYGRTIPLGVIQAAFPQVQGIDGLKGSKRLPSASRFQRVLRQWNIAGLGTHGSALLQAGRDLEELVALITREVAPGIDARYPQGRITMIAVNGSAATQSSEAGGGGSSPLMLFDGPLPASRFSFVRVYSAHRFDDVYGKPFVGDLDDLQVQLNRGLSKRAEYIERTIRPPLVTGGPIVEDTATWTPDGRIEVDPASPFQPFLLSPQADVAALNEHIDGFRNAMFTLGGYQAASRGESRSGDPTSKVIALAKADDTIHGPTNQRFREAVEEFGGLCHGLFREFGDIPWAVDVTGEEMSHLVEPWISKDMVSSSEPTFKLVSGFGATLESKANQLLSLVQTKGADGQPLMTTRLFQAQYPDPSMYPDQQDPVAIRERRAKTINARIRSMASAMEQGMDPAMASDPRLLLMAHQSLTAEFPMLPDDDPQANFDALTSITQDENEAQISRKLAGYRQAGYQMWMMTGQGPPPADPMALLTQMQQPGMPSPTQGPQGPQPSPGPGPQAANPEIAAASPGGTTSAEGLQPRPGEVAALTAEAGTGI